MESTKRNELNIFPDFSQDINRVLVEDLKALQYLYLGNHLPMGNDQQFLIEIIEDYSPYQGQRISRVSTHDELPNWISQQVKESFGMRIYQICYMWLPEFNEHLVKKV